MNLSGSINNFARKVLSFLPKPIVELMRSTKLWFLNRRSATGIFKQIYTGNTWDGTESVSGPGSTMAATENIRKALPEIIKEYNIRSILDIPCGDVYWIGECLPENIVYTGGDIVSEIIGRNKIEKGDLGEFITCNLVTDSLPEADLLIVRDCFIHLPNSMIKQALANIKCANIKLLLTTTYPDSAENVDIATGGFRPVDLMLQPFSLPAPLKVFEESEIKSGKCMGLWSVKDL